MTQTTTRPSFRDKVKTFLERMNLAWQRYEEKPLEWKQMRAHECLKAGAGLLEKSHKGKNM